MSKKVRIADLKHVLYVRARLNDDHVLALAELMENGAKIPPILVTPDLTVIDGRHRIEAAKFLNLDEIEAEVRQVNGGTPGLIAEAYKANQGAPLPPTREDNEHTVRLMIAEKLSIKEIANLLGLPPNLVRNYVNAVKAKMERKKVQTAKEAIVNDGLTLADAAKKFGVDPDKLKASIHDVKRKDKIAVRETKRVLTARFRSLSGTNAKLITNLFAQFDDGEVSESFVEDVFDQLERLLNQSTHKVQEWKKRFNSKKTEASKLT